MSSITEENNVRYEKSSTKVMELQNNRGDTSSPMGIGDSIRAERERRGLSQEALAKAVGISQPAIRKIESGETLRSRYLSEILAFLGMSDRSNTNKDLQSPLEAVPNVNPPPEILGERDLPVFSAVEGGPGEMVVDNEPFDHVTRPWYVRSVKEAFAVLVVGESMAPEFKPGRMAIVNPKLPVVSGEPAIFVNKEHGEFKATIKELVRATATHWIVRQHNPPEGQKHEFKLSRREWPEAFRVVGSYYR